MDGAVARNHFISAWRVPLPSFWRVIVTEHYQDGFDAMVRKTLEFVAHYFQTAHAEHRSMDRRSILETSWLRANDALELEVQNRTTEEKREFRDGMEAARGRIKALYEDPPPRV